MKRVGVEDPPLHRLPGGLGLAAIGVGLGRRGELLCQKRAVLSRHLPAHVLGARVGEQPPLHDAQHLIA